MTGKILKTFLVFYLLMALAMSSASSDAVRYEAKARRDPFVPLVGQDKIVITGLEDVTSVEDVNLEGIAIGPKGRRIAILNGETLKEDDKIGSLEMKKIYKNKVNISIGGKSYELKMPEEGKIRPD